MKPVLTHLAAAMIGGALVLLVIKMGNGERQAQLQDSTGDSEPHRANPIAARTQPRLDRSNTSGSPDISFEDFSAEAYEELLEKIGARRPTRAQLMDYIASRDGDPDAVFAAGLILSDANLLREAHDKSPDNPQYAFMLAAWGDVPEEERLAMAQRLLELQPDNVMASYLLASRQFATGEETAALDSLHQSLSQPDYDDFTRQTITAVEDAMRGTGSTDLGAELYSFWHLNTRHTFDVFQLAKQLEVDSPTLSPTDTQVRRRLAATMGVRMAEESPNRNLVTELIGLGIQSIAMEGLPDEASSPFQGLSVAEATDTLRQRRNEIRDNLCPNPGALLALSPDVFGGYTSRLRMLGEFEANLWLRRQPEFGSQLRSEK